MTVRQMRRSAASRRERPSEPATLHRCASWACSPGVSAVTLRLATSWRQTAAAAARLCGEVPGVAGAAAELVVLVVEEVELELELGAAVLLVVVELDVVVAPAPAAGVAAVVVLAAVVAGAGPEPPQPLTNAPVTSAPTSNLFALRVMRRRDPI